MRMNVVPRDRPRVCVSDELKIRCLRFLQILRCLLGNEEQDDAGSPSRILKVNIVIRRSPRNSNNSSQVRLASCRPSLCAGSGSSWPRGSRFRGVDTLFIIMQASRRRFAERSPADRGWRCSPLSVITNCVSRCMNCSLSIAGRQPCSRPCDQLAPDSNTASAYARRGARRSRNVLASLTSGSHHH